MTLNWRDGGKAPFEISGGAAVVDGNMAYVMDQSGAMCTYTLSNNQWSKISNCPYKRSSLAVINDQVTAIGGCKDMFTKDTYTNKLLSVPEYKEVFPPMPTKRRDTTAVTSKEHLIVAGGATGPMTSFNTTTVEVMNTKTLAWSTVASLPHPYSLPTGTICGEQLYILGCTDDKGKTKSVLSCSLTELSQSTSDSISSIWHRVSDIPSYWSTCAAVNGALLAVGGCDKSEEPRDTIHKYNPTTNSWDLISNMPTARYWSLVAVLPTNEMMVVGGVIDQYSHFTDIVEVANLI